MPIQTLDLIYQGVANFPIVDIDGTFDTEPTNDNDGTGGSYVVGYTFSSSDVFLTNNGLIASFVTTSGNGNTLLLNTSSGVIGGGTPFGDGDTTGNIRMTGFGTHLIANFGEIIADLQMGNGQDGIYNSALLDGEVRMGGGDDYFVNDSATAGITDLTGFVTGTVNMGSGNDVVLNAGQMARVVLGSGDDSYAVINPGDVGENRNNTTATAERVYGGTGDDTMFGGASDDLFYGGNDADLLNGANGDDRLYGGQGQDTLNGGNQNDMLYGGDSKDRLNGGNGDDTLSGGNGEDMLIGGRGNDRLIGGSGADTFVFAGNTGADIITDFDVAVDSVRLQLGGSFVDDTYVGAYGDDDVLSFISYNNGNAVLDVSGLYNSVDTNNSFTDHGGIQITFFNVAEDSLTGDNFITPHDYFPPEVLALG